MVVTISDLRARSEFFDVVGDRIWHQWWEPRGIPLSYITSRLHDNLNGDAIPFALVAHDGQTFVGTASVITSDLDARPDYTPWVAAVWVEPDKRSAGIGRALVARASQAGFMLGHEKIYLCAAPPRRSYYVELGWTPIETGVGPSDLTVFVREAEKC